MLNVGPMSPLSWLLSHFGSKSVCESFKAARCVVAFGGGKNEQNFRWSFRLLLIQEQDRKYQITMASEVGMLTSRHFAGSGRVGLLKCGLGLARGLKIGPHQTANI